MGINDVDLDYQGSYWFDNYADMKWVSYGNINTKRLVYAIRETDYTEEYFINYVTEQAVYPNLKHFIILKGKVINYENEI